MAKILVYNNDKNTMEVYFRDLNESMPYNVNNTLSVGEFRGSSNSDVLWTDIETMKAWNEFRRQWGRPIYVGSAFRRISSGGRVIQSQHYAGTAFDVGQNIDNDEALDALREAALDSMVWSYVEPRVLTPTWVHFDKRQFPPACVKGGYPLLKRGSKGNYVATLQDALINLGYSGGGLDGLFGYSTRLSVIKLQKDNGLSPDGVVGCNTWLKIIELLNK